MDDMASPASIRGFFLAMALSAGAWGVMVATAMVALY